MLRKEEKYFENIDDLSGLSKNHPMLSLSLLIVLFSLAGIPPLAGFFAKFYIFLAVIEKEMYFLVPKGFSYVLFCCDMISYDIISYDIIFI